jgi:hypothetical protein
MSLQRRISNRRPDERRIPQDLKYDVLGDYITVVPGVHLEGPVHPLYTNILPGRYHWIKNPQGFPWDINLYDDKFIYMWITELNWTNPKDYKKTKNRPTLTSTTIPFCKRYATPGDIVVATDTTIQIVQNCAITGQFTLGKVQCEFHGPTLLNLSGDIGQVPVMEIWYRWNGQPNGTFLTMEKFSLCKGLGLVRWNTQNWNVQANAYDPPNNETIFNLVRTGTINPSFLCTEP